MAPDYEFLFLLFSQLMLLLLVAGDYEGRQEKCPPSFTCGSLGNNSFPFTKTGHQDCGSLTIKNCDDQSAKHKKIQLESKGKWFDVFRIQDFQLPLVPITIYMRDNDLYELLQSKNCEAFYNYTLPARFLFGSFRLKYNSTLFKCNRTFHVNPPKDIYSYTRCPDYDLYYGPSITDGPVSSLTACTMIRLPIKEIPDAKDPFTFVTANMVTEVQLSDECANCHYDRRGQCQLDSEGKFNCANEAWLSKAGKLGIGKHKKIDQKLVVIIATVTAALGVGVLIIIIYFFRRRLWKEKSKAHQDFEAFLKNHGPLAVRRYSYLDIKKMTNFFAEKLGEGGYGGVFRGKTQDGHLVAVKVLNKSKGDGEEFINEVASISRTSHVNIVTLMGFCFEGSKRALIYEFMSNGSLEKFIYGTNPTSIDNELGCETLYQIAIGVARGLEYLHRGCNTRIFHFDIKPHNVLLDENFCPKISDFGLAKICPRNESIVSMLAARGTPGYIAPEVFSRNFGVVSHRSDVYSFGMMVLEMVGGRKNVNVEVDCSSEIYFPHWIYKRLELNEELALRNISTESERERMRKMVIVSLWCIQTKPSDRPTMSAVVEMLEGRLESLQMPPKPFLSSPSRSSPHSLSN